MAKDSYFFPRINNDSTEILMLGGGVLGIFYVDIVIFSFNYRNLENVGFLDRNIIFYRNFFRIQRTIFVRFVILLRYFLELHTSLKKLQIDI